VERAVLLRTVLSSIEYTTYRQEKDRECFTFSVLFFDKHCICKHKCDYSIVDMPRTARLDIFALLRNIFALLRNIFALLRNIFAKVANSICFRFAQTRYDVNPRSRSEHIELLMAHSCHQQYIERVSVYRKSVSADLYRRVVSLRALR